MVTPTQLTGGSNYDSLKVAHHLISDVHEWIVTTDMYSSTTLIEHTVYSSGLEQLTLKWSG